MDAAARERFGLTEELMMENAAAALERAVVQQVALTADGNHAQSVVVLCGSGNNGADGYALARRLCGLVVAGETPITPVVIAAADPASDLCKRQAERAQKCGVPLLSVQTDISIDKNNTIIQALSHADIIVDCIFGSGFHGDLAEPVATLCARANDTQAMRLACDVPTGVRADGTVAERAFCADCTVTMGALKLSLYSDAAKDVTGQVVCADLGISRALFEKDSPAAATLLDAEDLVLPHRHKQLVNKGSFGHVAVASGEKMGASCIAGQAALRFGAGLVSLVRLGEPFAKADLPQVTPELMTASDFPQNTTAIALGMGLGRESKKIQPYFDWLSAHTDIPCVLDADVFFADGLQDFLRTHTGGTVLTPHPKECMMLLQQCGLGNYTISDCVHNRPALIEQFCRAFAGVVLLVKGANPMIGVFDGAAFQLFVNPLGKNCLAKAGSGDVLAGLIAALLAQGQTPIDAAKNASLAHALASRSCKNDFALTPLTLIDAVANLAD